KALRVPHVRGRWGEITLRRAAELSGMVNHCDFVEQMTDGKTGKGSLRPDMVITLPGDRKIIVDSKVPLLAYLDALEARDEATQKACMEDHARQVATHIRQLSSKKYTQAFSPTPEFVVLFVPGENFFSAALTHRPDLIDNGVEKGVILATPTTLIALLKTVAYAWQQQRSHENAQEIRDLGAQLYQRLSTMGDNLGRLGRDIERCASSYNKTVGTLEKRVMVPARKLTDLGVSTREMPVIPGIDPGQTPIRPLKGGENHEIKTG
ncbi:MAG: DNA recombination protein RmuC, partial [Desulfobacterales bacterium]|nr:DNA recombination protein RmuC [Desulfobacterales bacterium]